MLRLAPVQLGAALLDVERPEQRRVADANARIEHQLEAGALHSADMPVLAILLELLDGPRVMSIAVADRKNACRRIVAHVELVHRRPRKQRAQTDDGVVGLTRPVGELVADCLDVLRHDAVKLQLAIGILAVARSMRTRSCEATSMSLLSVAAKRRKF